MYAKDVMSKNSMVSEYNLEFKLPSDNKTDYYIIPLIDSLNINQNTSSVKKLTATVFIF